MAAILMLEQPTANYGNPQIEDGYTKIANELLDAILRSNFSKRHMHIVLLVIRKTYGYNKKSDEISLSQIMAATGMDRANASTSISELISMKVLSKQQGRYAQAIELNKKYNEWGGLSKQQPVVKTTTEGLSKQQITVVKTTTTKETTKDNTKRKEVAKKKSFPEFIPLEAWEGFVIMRKAIKKPLTDRAITIAINKLTKFYELGYDIEQILDSSTNNCWQDLFEPKIKPVKSEFINK